MIKKPGAAGNAKTTSEIPMKDVLDEMHFYTLNDTYSFINQPCSSYGWPRLPIQQELPDFDFMQAIQDKDEDFWLKCLTDSCYDSQDRKQITKNKEACIADWNEREQDTSELSLIKQVSIEQEELNQEYDDYFRDIQDPDKEEKLRRYKKKEGDLNEFYDLYLNRRRTELLIEVNGVQKLKGQQVDNQEIEKMQIRVRKGDNVEALCKAFCVGNELPIQVFKALSSIVQQGLKNLRNEDDDEEEEE
ncbi:MAG: hypothetical protein EZS28_048890, partial [Streblomastix strix]